MTNGQVCTLLHKAEQAGQDDDRSVKCKIILGLTGGRILLVGFRKKFEMKGILSNFLDGACLLFLVPQNIASLYPTFVASDNDFLHSIGPT